jgi:hypothetical protein
MRFEDGSDFMLFWLESPRDKDTTTARITRRKNEEDIFTIVIRLRNHQKDEQGLEML